MIKDIAVTLINQSLVLDISLLNKFKLYRDLRAIQMHNQRVLVMKVEDKGNKDFSDW